jgi:hypothetical protein
MKATDQTNTTTAHLDLGAGGSFNPVTVSKTVADARATVGRMATDKTAGERVSGLASKNTLALWEGKLLRAPATEAERRALRIVKASAAFAAALKS